MRFSINDLYASAWECAIDSAANIINFELGTDFNRFNDWSTIELLAERMGLKFNANGELVDFELIAKVGSRKLYRVKEKLLWTVWLIKGDVSMYKKWNDIYNTENELIEDMLKTKSDVTKVPYYQLVKGYEYIESFKRYYKSHGVLTPKQLTQLKRLAQNVYNNVRGSKNN